MSKWTSFIDLEKKWKMHHIKKNWSYLLIINCMDHIVCILTLKCWFFNTHTHYSRILPSGFQKKIYGYFNRWIGLASTILFLFAFVSLMHLYARYIFFCYFVHWCFYFSIEVTLSTRPHTTANHLFIWPFVPWICWTFFFALFIWYTTNINRIYYSLCWCAAARIHAYVPPIKCVAVFVAAAFFR